jgi:hypothetical protein
MLDEGTTDLRSLKPGVSSEESMRTKGEHRKL